MLTIATLAWGALAFGAVYSWAFWPLLLASAVAGTLGLLARSESGRPVLLIPMLALAAAVIGQLVSLPSGVISAVSPATARFLEQYDLSYSTSTAAWHPLSISPGTTTVALVAYVAFSLFLLGTARRLEPTRLRVLMRGLVSLGALVAFIGIIQEPLYQGRVFGVWQPLSEKANPFGPFINRNHFAGWMLMMLPLSLGYLAALSTTSAHARKRGWRERLARLSSPQASELILVGFACIVMALALVMTRSKSGILGFLVAMLIAGYFGLGRQTTRPSRLASAAYLLVLTVVAFWLADLEAIAFRFVEMDRMRFWELAGRPEIWRVAASIAADFPLTGTGLGTFGVATLVYDPQAANRHLAQAHNDYLQFAVEGGALLGIPALLLLAAGVREIARRFGHPRSDDRLSRSVRVGAVTALAAIALQSVVDFSLQMPGNAALFCVACAIAMHPCRSTV